MIIHKKLMIFSSVHFNKKNKINKLIKQFKKAGQNKKINFIF